MTDPQATLAQFLTSVSVNDIPASTREKARYHLLDTVGAIIVGADSEVVSTALSTMRTVYGESGGTHIMVPKERPLPSLPAAFIHGIAAHACEVDDSGGCDHSGATTLPALLSALDSQPISFSGEDFLTAFIVGYEVSRRVQSALGGYDAANSKGWHSTGVCGVFGAAAASAKILSLKPTSFSHTLGIAGSSAAGTWAFMSNNSWTKKLHVGRACELGLSAALLARDGMTGSTEVFTAQWGGLLRTYMDVDDTAEAELTRGLGSTWMIDHASIKPYATCRSTHSTVDALHKLRTDDGLQTKDIASVQICCSDLLQQMCGAREWNTMAAAQMSVVAAATAFLRYGAVGPTELESLVNRDAAAEDIRRRISVVCNPELEGTEEPILSIELLTGDIIRVHCSDPSGGPTNSLSSRAIEDKFRTLTAGRLDPSVQDTVIAEITHVEEVPDIRTIFREITTAIATA